MNKEYKRTKNEFRGQEKKLLKRAWKNAGNGTTYGFFK